MCEGQSTTDLSGPVEGLPQRNPALGAQHLFQGTADNQFHDQVRGVPVRTVVVDGNDVGAVQPRRGARLPSHPEAVAGRDEIQRHAQVVEQPLGGGGLVAGHAHPEAGLAQRPERRDGVRVEVATG